MADANDVKPADAGQKPQDSGSGSADKPKVWSDDEVKKIIEERDKAKEKARKYDEDKRKAEEAKAIEEGRLKEVLTEREKELEAVRAKAKTYEEREAKEREEILAEIKDDSDKEIASELSLPALRKFVARQNKEAGGSPGSIKGSKGAQGADSPFVRQAGESWSQYQSRLSKLRSTAAK